MTDTSNTKRRWWLYIGAALVLSVGLALVFVFFPEEEKQLRQGFRNAVEKAFPEQAAEVANSYGLTHYGAQSAESTRTAAGASSVVLVHGLDEPGKVWMNLAPALVSEKLDVWEMRYPNDQPIVESAWLFYREISGMKGLGISEIIIVAHSMGGLVSREMLTNPQIGYMDKARAGEVPSVDRLIMVGTPNHGSELARFRIFGEVRDQWLNMWAGRGHVFRGILDGAGEAKIDLLPESQFLTTLNSRPHPEGVDMLSIAGVVSSWDDGEIAQLFSSVRANVPVAEKKMLVELEAFLVSMNDGVGDGAVTVASTQLEGVDHRTVPGTHLTMIRNVTRGSSRIPPAIPLIIERIGPIFSEQAD